MTQQPLSPDEIDHLARKRATRDDAGKLTLQLRGRPDKLVVSRLYAHLFKAL